MSKREAQRIVRRALRNMEASPEWFAHRFSDTTGGASGRTVRRWMNGESMPHPHVLRALQEPPFVGIRIVEAK